MNDSVQHTIDSLRQSNILLHLVDSTKNVMIDINPEKTFIDKYAPYITALITLIVLIATIVANRLQMKKDNMIKLRKEWIQDFKLFTVRAYRTMIEICITLDKMSTKNANKYSAELLEFINIALINYTIEGKEITTVIKSLRVFDKKYNEWYDITSTQGLSEKDTEKYVDELTYIAGEVFGSMARIIFDEIQKLSK